MAPPSAAASSVVALASAVVSTALLTATGVVFALSIGATQSGSRAVSAVGTFVATLALPAAVLVSLADADFKRTNVAFIISATMAKAMCALVASVVAAAGAQVQKSAWAGAAVLLVTQSNDIAVGYPIVEALFRESRPSFATQLFLVAPVQLIVFTSAGTALLNRGQGGTLGETLRQTARLPLVVASVLGLVVNASGGNIWKPLRMTLEALAAAYPATALVSLGAHLATSPYGGTSASGTEGLAVAGVLACKHLLSPAVAAVSAYALSKGDKGTGTLAFLYGSLPVAPSVPVLASELLGDSLTSRKTASIAAVSVVASLFVSAPMLLCSGLIFSGTRGNEASSDYFEILGTAAVPAYVLSVVGGVILLVSMLRRGWMSESRCAIRSACCTLVMVKLACSVSAVGFLIAQSYGALGNTGYWREIAFAPWSVLVLANKSYLCLLMTRVRRRRSVEDSELPIRGRFTHMAIFGACIAAPGTLAMIHGPAAPLDPSSGNSATWWLLFGPLQIVLMDTASAIMAIFCSWCIYQEIFSSALESRDDMNAPLLADMGDGDEIGEHNDRDDGMPPMNELGADIDVQEDRQGEDLLHSRILLFVGFDVITQLIGISMDVLWALGASFSSLLLVVSVLFAVFENGSLAFDAFLLFPFVGIASPWEYVRNRLAYLFQAISPESSLHNIQSDRRSDGGSP